HVRDAEAEHLPYHDLSFDFVVMAFCISYFKSVHFAFKEAHRVLKPSGALIVGFLDKDSTIGKEYEARRQFSVFYKQAMFYSPERIMNELKMAGFKAFTFSQTLFNPIEDIKELQLPKQGFGDGSFVVARAIKK
ncbi:MAG: class I SAM-dependent methyltransferase, partial [Flavisolibacter sp.]